MKREEPNPASPKEKTETADTKRGPQSNKDFESKVNLPGKVDSGPEPDVFGRDIPPQ